MANVVKITGQKALLRKFAKVGKTPSINRALRPLMTKAARAVATQAKNNVKGINKHVAKSIGQKSITYKSDKNLVKIIGVRVYTSRKIKAGGSKNNSAKNSALIAKEAKEIEFGTNPDVQSFPFMRKALQQQKGAVISILSQVGKSLEKQLKNA